MKKIFLRSLTLASIISGVSAHSAFAQDVAPSKNSDAPKVDPILSVLGRYSLFDSTRKSNVDFFNQRFRFGARYTQGAFYAAGEVQFYGNTSGQNPTNDNTSTGYGNTVGVRQAYVGLDLSKNDLTTVAVVLGRFVPNGANQYGNDAIVGQFGTSGFGPNDGVLLQYSSKYGFGNLVAQVGVTSGLPLWVYNDPGNETPTNKIWHFSTGGSNSILNGGSAFGGDSNNTRDKAYIANVSANIDAGDGKVEAVVAVAQQNSAVQRNTYFQPVASTTCTGSNPQTCGASVLVYPSTARDVTYLETSVGYNDQDLLKAGLWFTRAELGSTKRLNSINGGAQTFGNDDGVKDQYNQVGVGVQANSKMFGVTNILTAGDAFTYSGGAQVFMHRQSGSSAAAALSDSSAQSNDVTQVSLGAGYQKGPMSFEANYAYFTASNDMFNNYDKGETSPTYTNAAHMIYLVGSFQL